MPVILRTLLLFLVLAAAGFAAPDLVEPRRAPWEGHYSSSQQPNESKKKAEAGDAHAQIDLYFMYRYGEGVLKNVAQAMWWLRKAAEAGDAVAQSYLGEIYQSGDGVPKDRVEAVKWYRMAAEQGHVYSQTQLGFMYYSGDGVPKDLIQAHVWFNIAGAKGNEEAKKNREAVEEQMTADQITEAEKMAPELFAKIPKK